MSNSFGDKVKITIFGQSHSEAMGVVIDGLPAGEAIDLDEITNFMERRAPGRNPLGTSRREPDIPRILSGLYEERTCGAPLAAVIENRDMRSSDYDSIKVTPRPSHADFTAFMKHHGFNDIRGGGQFSGRLTAPLCFAGAVCLQLLARRGVTVGAQILEIAGVRDKSFDTAAVSAEELSALSKKSFPVVDDSAGELMSAEIEQARSELDSVGGIVRCYALGLPPGLGDPMFDGLENRLAQAVFAIPAVKGLSFGSGVEAAGMKGSEHNDPFFFEDGRVKTRTNNHGGILGGISSGMPVWFDVAFKPTPSIGLMQATVDLVAGQDARISVKGRHDPCIVPRAVPCVEAAAAITILDYLMK